MKNILTWASMASICSGAASCFGTLLCDIVNNTNYACAGFATMLGMVFVTCILMLVEDSI